MICRFNLCYFWKHLDVESSHVYMKKKQPPTPAFVSVRLVPHPDPTPYLAGVASNTCEDHPSPSCLPFLFSKPSDLHPLLPPRRRGPPFSLSLLKKSGWYFIHNFCLLHPKTYKDILETKRKNTLVLVSSRFSSPPAVRAHILKPTSSPAKEQSF